MNQENQTGNYPQGSGSAKPADGKRNRTEQRSFERVGRRCNDVETIGKNGSSHHDGNRGIVYKGCKEESDGANVATNQQHAREQPCRSEHRTQ
jgi:hypothetical protein